ncbi:hypothetical protein [Gordoniibacillus kamchatkensis]|nr:hypothetical protein [Paenibacillus sp. VKM B-2647]
MATLIGFALLLAACLVAVGIVRIAGKSIREYNESEHESFLGK